MRMGAFTIGNRAEISPPTEVRGTTLVPWMGRIKLLNWMDCPPWQEPLKYPVQPYSGELSWSAPSTLCRNWDCRIAELMSKSSKMANWTGPAIGIRYSTDDVPLMSPPTETGR